MEAPPSPRNLRQIPVVCPGHSRPIAEIQYSSVTPDGFFLISACHDKLPMLRRGDTGDWIGTFDGHKGAVWSAKVDATAQYAVSGSADFSVKLWDALSGDCITTFDHKHIVKSVEFSLDGSKLLTGGHEKILRVYDLLTIIEQLETYRSEGRTGIVIMPSPPIAQMTTQEQIRKIVAINNQWVATGEVNGTITIWNLDTNEKVHEFSVETGIMDMEITRQGSILTVAAGKKVYFYDVKQNWSLIHCYEMPISFHEEGGASLHPTLPLFIAGGSDTWVRVFDYNTGELVETHKGHHGPVRCLRYAPNGDSFATGSEDGTIRIWQSDMTSKAAIAVSNVKE